jgi:hypothetical protein
VPQVNDVAYEFFERPFLRKRNPISSAQVTKRALDNEEWQTVNFVL